MPISCHLEPFSDYATAIPKALDAIGAAKILAEQSRILIKPNLVKDSPPPVTTALPCAAALIRYLRDRTKAQLILAEGSGENMLSTIQIFDRQGYFALAEEYDLKLIDLNQAPLLKLARDDCKVFPEIWLPKLVMESFIISLAPLKAHSLSEVTLSMKNMIGCAPPSHYQRGGHWKKSAFHRQIHQSIFELNLHRKPDLAIVDAKDGLSEYHLGGPLCDPPPNRIVAGFDPVAVDAAGATLLGRDWRQVEHIQLADGVLGSAADGEKTCAMNGSSPTRSLH
ncbi:MAG: hypothetical protein C0616_13395 [Desulfuromonas sp.]|nr:MAG: hypothetical protein C0616_13395 [Desulfuromonas sp.]